MTSIQELASSARAVNAANDWGLDFTLAEIPNYIALIHSEVTEAYTAHSNEEILGELADVLIRTLDLCELIHPNAMKTGPLEDVPAHFLQTPATMPRVKAFMELNTRVTEVLEVYRKVVDTVLVMKLIFGLQDVISWTVGLMYAVDPQASPTALVLAKIEKNRSRGHRHGGRRT